MKNLFTLLILFFAFGLFAQNSVSINFNHKLGAADFSLNTVVTAYDGYDLDINRLQYYLNDFIITHDGGQETTITDHFLIDPNFPKNLSLGAHDIVQVEKITFSIGVHPDLNHTDPTSYNSIHPLAPKNPSMHWGWVAGYRFIALEGKSGANISTIYEIHALGDENYKTISIPTGGTLNGSELTITIDADYLGMFKNMDVSEGLFNHGEGGASITLLDNFATDVFYPEGGIPVATVSPAFEGKFQIQPNPSFDKTTQVVLDLPTADDFELTLTDLTGRVIQTQKVSAGKQSIEINSQYSGIFFIHLWKDSEPVAFEKWVVK